MKILTCWAAASAHEGETLQSALIFAVCPPNEGKQTATRLSGPWVNAHKAKRPGNAELQRQVSCPRCEQRSWCQAAWGEVMVVLILREAKLMVSKIGLYGSNCRVTVALIGVPGVSQAKVIACSLVPPHAVNRPQIAVLLILTLRPDCVCLLVLAQQFCSHLSFVKFMPQLDAWVAQHEEEEARAERAQQAAMAEDGWTVVVRSKVAAAGPSWGSYCHCGSKPCRFMETS
eukprot:scaffold131228_cov16-Tisochrysis_lutea.AAC.1